MSTARPRGPADGCGTSQILSSLGYLNIQVVETGQLPDAGSMTLFDSPENVKVFQPYIDEVWSTSAGQMPPWQVNLQQTP